MKIATAAIAKAVQDRAEADKALAATAPDLNDTQRNIHAIGVATGALGNFEFRKYLNERGITDNEMDGTRQGLAKLARAFYVDPEAERE